MAVPAFGASKDVIYASEFMPKSLDPHDTTDTYSGAIEKAMIEGLMGLDKDLADLLRPGAAVGFP